MSNLTHDAFLEAEFPLAVRSRLYPLLTSGLDAAQEFLANHSAFSTPLGCNINGRLINFFISLYFSPDFWPASLPGRPLLREVNRYRYTVPVIRGKDSTLFLAKSIYPCHYPRPRYLQNAAAGNGGDTQLAIFMDDIEDVRILNEPRCVLLNYGVSREREITFARLSLPDADLRKELSGFDLLKDFKLYAQEDMEKQAAKREEKELTQIRQEILSQISAGKIDVPQ